MADPVTPDNRFSITDRFRSAFLDPGGQSLRVNQPPKRRGLVFTFCLLSSAGLWFMFSVQETYTQFFDFPTSLENVPDDLALTALPPSSVRVQIEGKGVQLIRLYYNPPTIQLDGSNQNIDMAVAVADVTGNVRTESVMPAQLEIPTEERIGKRVPVQARVTLTTDTGFHSVGEIVVDPDSITVSGARSIIQQLEYWPSVPLRVDRARSFVRRPVQLADTLSGLVDKDAEMAAYQVDVQQFTEIRRPIDIRVEGAPSGREITFVPATTTVTFQVPLVQFDLATNASDFYAVVQFEDIQADTTGKVFAEINLPEGLVIRESRIAPESFGYYFNLPERQ